MLRGEAAAERMKDPGLQDYVDAVEGHLRALRGVDHVLNPRDFALVRGWYEAGVPLATILVGTDHALQAGQPVTSLVQCRRFVEELAGRAVARRPAAPAIPAAGAPLEEVRRRLEVLGEELPRLRAARGLDGPLHRVREMLDLLTVARQPNLDYVRHKLEAIDAEVAAALLAALSADEADGFRAEAARAVARHRGRVDETSLEDAVERYTIIRARERFGLPRVGLV